MNNRHIAILTKLKQGEYTYAALAYELGRPEPSIRRDVQELRKQSYDISALSSCGRQVYLRLV